MGFNLLGLGIQAAQANKTALGVVGQNISNVNTPGYNRQVATLVTQTEQRGVTVESINRVTDDFLTRQLWADTASFNRTDIFADMAAELDNLLASSTTSISTALDNYFKALQNAVDDPTSLPNRELFVAEADALTKRFNDLNTVVVRQNEKVNENLESFSSQVTAFGKDIADLNDKIRLNVVAGKPANELRDQRDRLVEDLSKLVDVQVIEQDGGEFSVFVANGQPLVVGLVANEMVSTLGDPDASLQGIALKIAGNEVDVTDGISSGKIGGLLQYREDILQPTMNELGRIAIAVSETMNEQHKKGMGLDGNLGGLLFSDVNSSAAMSSRLLANDDNIGKIDQSYVKIVDVGALEASDYEMVIGENNQLTIKRLSDDKRYSLSDFTKVPASPLNSKRPEEPLTESGTYFMDVESGYLQLSLDGFTLELDMESRLVEGDRYLIQPTRHGAAQMGMTVTDGRQLALAQPIRVSIGPDNKGTGEVDIEVTDVTATSLNTKAGELTPPVDIVFNNSTPSTFTIFDMTDPTNPVALVKEGFGPLENQIYNPGEPIELDGYNITIRNQPSPGDRFSFGYNTDGVSDNRNALLMSNLQLKDTIDGGSYQDIYGRLIEHVGTKTSVANINREASEAVLTSTQETKSSVSGVNLDEEAAKLIQFQQAYQASAQLITASQTLFDSLLSSIRG